MPRTKDSKTITVGRAIHDVLNRESFESGLTIRAFTEKILSDALNERAAKKRDEQKAPDQP